METTGAAELLRAVDLRITRPRLAVLNAVRRHPHADVDTVVGAVRAELGSVSVQAVYDVLRAFTDAGLVRRIEPAGSPARFEARVGDNHHHVVCRGCGAIADLDCPVEVAPCLDVSATDGFVIDEAEVTFWGRCPACSSAPAARQPVLNQPVLNQPVLNEHVLNQSSRTSAIKRSSPTTAAR